jgi:hypothetical protein
LLINKEHLTPEGFSLRSKIIAIKASINNGLSEALKEAFFYEILRRYHTCHECYALRKITSQYIILNDWLDLLAERDHLELKLEILKKIRAQALLLLN